MKYLILLLIILFVHPVLAFENERYLDPNKIIYEEPQESDVLRINVSVGYTTVLEFSEKPSLVTTGDSSLIQVEVPKNSKAVLLKALRPAGETNLFVFTRGQRFNYKINITDTQDVDYVVDVKESLKDGKLNTPKIPVSQIVKMARNYQAMKLSKQINPRLFVQKDILKEYSSPDLTINVVEAFVNQTPHYLVVHFIIQNRREVSINLNEKNSSLYVNGQKIKPGFILFDAPKLDSRQLTNAWLVLEGTYISLDNKFTMGVGVDEQEYIF